jgi:diguanylate cyclase (GGDEF)-like protein/PAS domain S-box-containing protein
VSGEGRRLVEESGKGTIAEGAPMDDIAWLRQILDHVEDGVYMVDESRRIQFWNPAAKRITGFTAQEVMGHCCADNILTHVDRTGCSMCKGECPMARTLIDGKTRKDVVFLHHKEGFRVPVEVAVNPVKDGSGKTIGAVETFRECSDIIAMRSTIERLKQWGCVDVATGLMSHRIVADLLERRAQEMQRFGWPFGVLMIEVDLLQEVEQAYGSDGKAQGIRIAAASVQNALRALDTVGRWDETTFVAVVANTPVMELKNVAERVRMMVDTAYRTMGQGQLHVTVSIGAAAAEPKDNAQSVLQKARTSLYASRSSGRNRVTVHGLTGE